MDLYDHLAIEDLKINAVVMAGFAYQAAMRDEKFPRKPFSDWNPQFTLHQPDLFKEGSALTNAIADFDNDGDLDIFVGFNNKPSRMYRNDHGTFKDVAAEVGLADVGAIRTSAWGDYDGDGNLDLFIASVSGDQHLVPALPQRRQRRALHGCDRIRRRHDQRQLPPGIVDRLRQRRRSGPLRGAAGQAKRPVPERQGKIHGRRRGIGSGRPAPVRGGRVVRLRQGRRSGPVCDQHGRRRQRPLPQ